MKLFDEKISEIETRLVENLKKTKSVFPEETSRIESGLVLMKNVTRISNNAVIKYPVAPNLVANHNLFARNRQLILNAYFCLLNSSYGTQFVILRTVLENNNLMRLFNNNPQYAFEWFSKDFQRRFSIAIQSKYGKSQISNKKIKIDLRKHVFTDVSSKSVRVKLADFHDQLSKYIHPNFVGWQELVGKSGETEIILNMPSFQLNNAEKSVGIMLYLMQLSFKAFVETFKKYITDFAFELKEWQDSYNKLILKFRE